MEKQISEKLKKTVGTLDEKFRKNVLYKKFELSSMEFDLMVEKGWIKKRGNNSSSLLDLNSSKVIFNV